MNVNSCNGCSACAASCPKDAIQMVESEDGFYKPKITEKQCIHCGICEKVCREAQKSSTESEPMIAYAARNTDPDVVLKSSSGGVFRALAEKVLREDGVIFGCAWSEDLRAIHTAINSEETLTKLQKSKYVQSYIGNCYRSVRTLLNEDKMVLFSGTPCQVSGLYAFLGTDYQNLITCDFICHGVPSIKSFREYISFFEDRHQKSVNCVDFRDKTFGWEKLAIKVQTTDGQVYVEKANDNPYYKAFLCNLSINGACAQCTHNSLPRKSDFTFADFWGIDKTNIPHDRNGTSALIVNTRKGQALIEKTETLILQETSVKHIMQGNPFLNGHCVCHPRQKVFMNDLGKKEFDILVNELLTPTPLEYVQEVGKYQISKLVQKIRTLEKVANHKIQIQRRRLKLTHRDITIISNNCWGGFIYQKYGLEYRTPTIGLFFLGDDYVKFCSKLEFYLSKPIEFIPWESSRLYQQLKDHKPYPIGKLGDIEVYFMHYHSEEEAREKWERRKSRINKERILFKLSQREYCSKEDIEKFMALPYKNKICFAYDKVPGAIYVPELRGFSGDEQPIVTPYLDDLKLLNGLK